MSWLCVLTLSCLANPAAPMSLPTAPEIVAPQAAEPIPVAAHARPAPPAARPSASAQPLRCELRQVRRDGAQVVVAVVRADAPAEGEYEFSVEARDAWRNSVSSSTGDAFRIRAGEPLEIEGPSLALGRGAALAGHLELRDERGETLTKCKM